GVPPELVFARPVAQAVLDAGASIAALAVLVLGLRQLARSRHGSLLLERIGRRLPVAAPILPLEASATLLPTPGAGLASRAALPAALERSRDALGGRLAAPEVEVAMRRARDGASIEACLEGRAFVDETTAWLVQAAAKRPDLPREILALARTTE